MDTERNMTGLGWMVVAVVVVLLIIGYYLIIGTGSPNTALQAVSSTTPIATEADSTIVPSGQQQLSGGSVRTSEKEPVVDTIGFASVSTSTAVVVGTVTPEGSDTTYWFEYGTTLDFGKAADTRSADAGTGKNGAAAYITGLTPATEYYFRIAAQNAYGRVYGPVYAFITNSL